MRRCLHERSTALLAVVVLSGVAWASHADAGTHGSFAVGVGHAHHHRGHGYHVGYHGSPWYYGYWGGWYVPPTVYVEPVATGPGLAALETDVRPGRAEVLLNGATVGQARDYNGRWDRLWLEPGRYVIEFRKPGYQTLRRAVELSAGGHVRISERLARGDGPDPRSTELPPERPAEEPTPRGSLARGLLHLDVRPPGAAVYLDGEFLADASELSRLHGALPMARGPHVIEVVRPGFVSEKHEVVVTGDAPVRLRVELKRE